MQGYTGPTLESYLIVISFIIILFFGFYFLKKNRHIISKKLNSKKRMTVSEITILGQGDRALILNLDHKDYLYISGKNSGALLTEIKSLKTNKLDGLENVFEKRLMNEKN